MLTSHQSDSSLLLLIFNITTLVYYKLAQHSQSVFFLILKKKFSCLHYRENKDLVNILSYLILSVFR